jgi:glycosyltransferase involved in cell wall biosynthesis
MSGVASPLPGRARIRIVHVLDNLNTGGTELNAVRTAERLDRDRFDVSFLCLQPEGPLRARLDAAGVPVHDFRVSGLLSADAVRRGWEVRSLMRQGPIAILHAHDPYANVLSVPWGRLAHRGAVIASHRWWRSVHRRRLRVANRLAYRLAHRVLANSPAVGELVIREEGVPRERLVVIPNFVDEAAFQPLPTNRRAELRAQVGLGPDDFAIGVIANLYPVKAHSTLLNAAARLAFDWPEVRFVLIGEGSERPGLVQQAAAAGIADRVLMPGRLAHEPGVPGILDIAVLTSREEGFPNFVVEAMAAGRPVVATAVGGVPDAVEHGVTGLLVPEGDDQELANALISLLRDRTARERMGTRGAERARQLYHVDVVLGELQSLYQDLALRYGR